MGCGVQHKQKNLGIISSVIVERLCAMFVFGNYIGLNWNNCEKFKASYIANNKNNLIKIGSYNSNAKNKSYKKD